MKKQHMLVTVLLCILIIAICAGGCLLFLVISQSDSSKTSNIPKVTASTSESDPKPVFSSEEIPPALQEKMWGVTISESSPVSFEDLRCLTISFYDYNGKIGQGKLIVHCTLAQEVLQIFRELYKAEFPIEKMQPACFYYGDDILSMADNNTSAFNDRPIESSGGLSFHQLGAAIDINPLVNPYIQFSTNTILPPQGEPYLDRSRKVKGMIQPDDVCVQIFKKYGWRWGGDWSSLKDYQHFEKDI
ncbi:M15 family metallopeptidase [Oscillospiraceae bacterium DSM 107454]|uniref:M15 family metallopeptidase n=1 Tax=Ructibacterium gallinarum TaxID=2779355 RepID=A0A9D5M2B4_9FIRM|nr:M15 family metallopeptidase [Ructibacterium gallinarum]